MSIEIGQVIIHCDGCVTRLVHDPSPDPISDFTRTPRWSSKDAVAFAIKNGWSIEYDPDVKAFAVSCPSCPSCVSEMATVKSNRQERGKVVLKDKQTEQSLDDEWAGFGSFLTDTPDEKRYDRNRKRSVKGGS